MRLGIATMHLLYAAAISLFVTSSYGQLTKQWQTDYPYIYDSDKINYGFITGNKLQFDGNGNCYFFSEFTPRNTNTSFAEYHAQMQTIKYNSAGTTLWTHRDTSIYQNNCYNCGLHPYKMIVNSDGTSYGVASEYNGAYIDNAALTATLPTGVGNWRNRSVSYGPKDIVQDYQGSNIVVSNSQTIDGYGEQYIILNKVNTAGSTNWTVSHAAPDGWGWTQDQKTVTDKYGNLYVAASTYHYGGNGNESITNLFITKYNAAGTVLWDRKIDSVKGWRVTDAIYNLVDTSVYICAYSTISTVADDTSKIKLLKVSNAGNLVWTKTEGPSSNIFMQLKTDNSGNVYWWRNVIEYGYTYQPDYYEGEIIKYNSAGARICRMSGNSFDVDASGYIYTSHAFVKNYVNYNAIRKYSAAGSLLFDYPGYVFTGTGAYYAEVYKDKLSNVYALINDLTISVIKYSAACNATAAPAKPKSITGPATIYCNASASYSCPVVSNAVYYNWMVPTGVVIDSGQGTTKIYVSNTVSFKKGTVAVYAANCYGASAAVSKTVVDTLKTPGAITGAASVCKGQTYVQYSVAAVAGATDYIWTVPAGASIACGNHTNSICVSFGNAGGALTVAASNNCGVPSPARSKQVKVTNCVAGMSVEIESSKSVVYPNPSSDAFTLRFSRGYHSSVHVVVKDVSGKVVEQLSSVKGSSISFGGKLVKGVYFVEVMSGEDREVLKVVKE